KPRREAVRPGWHHPVGTGHAREMQPLQRASPVRGHGPTPTKPRREAVLPGWHYPVETGHARECNHTSVLALFVGMAHSYQGEKRSVLAGTILWERAMPVKCNHTSVQALVVGMDASYPAKAGNCARVRA